MADPFKEYKYTPRWGGNQIEHRPLVPVEVIANGKTRNFRGLVDSGCETTTLNIAIATMLGVSLDDCEPTRIGGVGNAPQTAYRCELLLRMPDFDCEFTSPVLFANMAADVLLGFNNFFEHFRVNFERDKDIFTLTQIPKLKH